MPLRPSQVETLRLVGQRERLFDRPMEPWRLAQHLGRTEQSARARLDRLQMTRHVYANLSLDARNRYYRSSYRLTQLGREALEGQK